MHKPIEYYRDQNGIHPIFGYNWQKIENPGTGNLAARTDGWTADSFSDGLEVDFSGVVPAGTKAVRCSVQAYIASGTKSVWYRKSGDPNISNTPGASAEFSHIILTASAAWIPAQVVLWLSVDYKVQFAAEHVDIDLYIRYPIEYLF